MPAEAGHSALRDARGASVNLLTLLAQASLPAFHVQLARVLGADGYGLYSWSSGFVDMFSMLTLLGMDVALAKQVSIAHARGDTQAAAQATGTALRVVLLSGVLVALGIALSAPLIATFQDMPGLVAPLRILSFMPIAYHVATVLLVATQARMVMRYDFWARGITQPLLLLLLTTICLQAGAGVVGASAAVVVAMSFVALLTAYFYGRELPWAETLRRALRGPWDLVLIKEAAPLVALNLVGALQGRIDTILLGHYRPAAEVGAYGACIIYVVSFIQVRSVFYPVVAATLPSAIAAGDWGTVREVLQRQTRWIAVLAMPLAVLFAGFGDGLLAIFGAEFLSARDALALLALGYLTSSHTLAAYVLVFSQRVRYIVASALACIIVQAILLPLLIPDFGLSGAAASAAIGLCISNGLQLFFTWRVSGVQPFSWGWVKVAVAALVSLVVGRALFVGLAQPLAVRFFGAVGFALVVYASLLLVLGLRHDELELLRGVLHKLRTFGSRKKAE